MAIYLITISILFAFSVHELASNNNKQKRLFLIFSYFLMVILVGLRWETGTDWEPYLAEFENSENFKEILFNSTRMEKGYLAINSLLYSICPNYSVFLLLLSALMYFFYFKSFIKISKYPQLVNLLLFSSTLGSMGSNRQLLAGSIILYGISHLANKKKLIFLISILASFLFHTTSLTASVFYFFNRKIKSWILYVSIFIAYLIGKTQLSLVIFAFFGNINQYASEKTDAYLRGAQEELLYTDLSMAGVVKRLLFVFLFIILREKIEKKLDNYNLLLNGYIFGVIFYFLFSSSLIVMISRGSFYFNLMEPFLLVSIIYALKRGIDKLIYLFILLALSIMLMYQSVAPYPDLFEPYKSIFFNTDFQRFMY